MFRGCRSFSGHFLPTVPFARALVDRGHEVLYACQDAMVGTVEAMGWRAEPSGGATLLAPGQRRPLVHVDRVAEERAVRRSFAGRVAATRVPPLRAIAERWRPDLVVRDEMDFAGAVAAERLGLPHAAVMVIAAGGFARPDVVGEPLARLRAEHGLNPDEAVSMLHRYLSIVAAPPSYRDPRGPLPTTAHHVRPAVLEGDRGRRVPARPVAPQGRLRVYFTLGTVFPQESGDLFARVLAGISSLPVDVLVTVGDEIGPAELGDQPPNVSIEQFLPLADVLAESDVVVSHGGSGTVVAALALGLPQVLLPMGADQPLNADRCTALGIAVALDAMTSTPTEIAGATYMVLSDPSYRANVGPLRDEAASLPDVGHAASLLERLARSCSPVTSD